MNSPESARRRSKARWAITGWTVGLAASLSMGAVAVWAVIRLVVHFT